jgi:N-methylhydantoinase A/oxoprolinase/acetone carboxylase beta subunit
MASVGVDIGGTFTDTILVSDGTEFPRGRLDIVGLDDDGEIALVIEVERINNDTR